MGPQRKQETHGGLGLVLKAEGPGVTPSMTATPLRVTNHLAMKERVRRKSTGVTRNGWGEGTGNRRVGRSGRNREASYVAGHVGLESGSSRFQF